MNEEQCAELQTLYEESRQGRWEDSVTDEGHLVVLCAGDPIWPVAYFGDMEETDKYDHANARFVAAAHTAVPLLLEEVADLRAQLAKWEGLTC